MKPVYMIRHVDESNALASLVNSLENGAKWLRFKIRDSEDPSGVWSVVVLPNEGQGVKNLLLAGVQEWLGSRGKPVALLRPTTYGAEYVPTKEGRGVMGVAARLSLEYGAVVTGPFRWEGHETAIAWRGSRGMRFWVTPEGEPCWHEVRKEPSGEVVSVRGLAGDGNDWLARAFVQLPKPGVHAEGS